MEGIEEDEEERILRENPDLVSLVEVDIESILSRYTPGVLNIQPVKEEEQQTQLDDAHRCMLDIYSFDFSITGWTTLSWFLANNN